MKSIQGLDHPPRIPRQDVVLTWAGDEALLVDERAGQVNVINRPAAKVWELLGGGRTDSDIADEIASWYGIDRSLAQTDVEAILANFARLDLFE